MLGLYAGLVGLGVAGGSVGVSATVCVCVGGGGRAACDRGFQNHAQRVVVSLLGGPLPLQDGCRCGLLKGYVCASVCKL